MMEKEAQLALKSTFHLVFKLVIAGLVFLTFPVWAQDKQHLEPEIDLVLPTSSSLATKKSFIYNHLLADIARDRGFVNTASEAMAVAGRLSRDQKILNRAYNFAMDAQRADLALEMARELVSLGLDLSRSQVMLLRAYIALDEPDKVLEVLVTLLERKNSDVDLVIRYVGEVFSSLENPGRWIIVMDRLIEHFPNRPEVYLVHAFVSYRSGETEKAHISLNKALELRPGWEEAAVFKLIWWSEIDARRVIKTFSEDFLVRFPNSDRLQLAFARLLLRWGDISDALRNFSELIERQPENIDAIFAIGLIYLQESRYQLATEMFERYLKIKPDSDQVRLYLARIAREEGRYEAALEWLSSIYSQNFRFEAQLEVGRVISDQGRSDEAINHLARILPRNVDEQVQIYLTEEQILRSVDKFEQAFTLLNAALSDIPDDPELLYARGLVAAQLEKLVEHERDMRRVIEIQPDNAHAYNALGYTLADQSLRLDEALMLIEKAISLRPQDPFILDSLGWVYYRLGDFSLALDNLRKAFNIRVDPEIAAHLGEVLYVLGKIDEARDVWRIGQETKNGLAHPVLQETMGRFNK